MRFQDTKLVSKPNPKRVAAGKLNRQKRHGLTDVGRERLRAAALQHQPWLRSTGPRTTAGKLQVANNGRTRQKGIYSLRQIKAELHRLKLELAVLRETRSSVAPVIFQVALI